MPQAGERPPLPPFDMEAAVKKVRMAEDGWNSRDPAKVSLAYTADSVWRNRSEFLQGRAATGKSPDYLSKFAGTCRTRRSGGRHRSSSQACNRNTTGIRGPATTGTTRRKFIVIRIRPSYKASRSS